MHLTVAMIFALCVTYALARSGGAPGDACSDLMPQHMGNQAQSNPSTNIVDLSNFPNVTGGEIAYMPGATYTGELPCCCL